MNFLSSTASFVKYYEDIKKELKGNFTNVEVIGEEFPLPAFNKYASRYYLLFFIINIILLSFYF